MENMGVLSPAVVSAWGQLFPSILSFTVSSTKFCFLGRETGLFPSTNCLTASVMSFRDLLPFSLRSLLADSLQTGELGVLSGW